MVLGAGYAGTGVVTALEGRLPDADLAWVSERDYHLVRHEVHRVVREPSAARHLRVPVADVAGRGTTFREATVAGVDADTRTVELADVGTVDYDYLVVAIGSRTAFYGIPGLRERALTLETLADAERIHDRVLAAGRAATPDDPARVVIGGAGLSGVQLAGEVAELRDREGLPLEVTVVEAMDHVLPGSDAGLRDAVAGLLRDRSIATLTGTPVVEVADDAVYVEGDAHVDADDVRHDEGGVLGGEGDGSLDVRDDGALPWDVLVWTGGITGPDAVAETPVERDRHRIRADGTFRTSDERVFALGDVALVAQDGASAPPTAQAAWQAADVAARNVARAVAGEPLEEWTYRDRGTLVSVGDAAVAHDVPVAPVETFGGAPARFLKKFVAARWIASVTTWRRALRAWSSL